MPIANIEIALGITLIGLSLLILIAVTVIDSTLEKINRRLDNAVELLNLIRRRL